MDNQSLIGKPLRAGVLLIEFLLRKSMHVYEFTDDPECILRIQLTPATHSVELASGKISKGELVLVIHAWNERMPQIPPEGPSMEWAIRLKGLTVHSFEAIAKELQQGGKYALVRTVYGESNIFSFSKHTGGLRMMQRFGFTIIPSHSATGKFGEFWANLFSWWLMWAFNNVSLDSRDFRHLERTEAWVMVGDFIQRFGQGL